MRKNKFFDTIMIALVLMTCFKLLYPEAFSFNITVNSSTVDSSQGSEDSDGSSDEPYLPEYTYDDFYEYLNRSSTGSLCTNEDDLYPLGQYFYSDSSCLELSFHNLNGLYTVNGEAYCYVDGVLWYEFDLASSGFDEVDYNYLYTIETPCNWISLDSFFV